MRVNHKIVHLVDAQVPQASGSLLELLARWFQGLCAKAVMYEYENGKQLRYAIPKQLGDLVGDVARLCAFSSHQLDDECSKTDSARDWASISGKDDKWNAAVEEAAVGDVATIVVTNRSGSQ